MRDAEPVRRSIQRRGGHVKHHRIPRNAALGGKDFRVSRIVESGRATMPPCSAGPSQWRRSTIEAPPGRPPPAIRTRRAQPADRCSPWGPQPARLLSLSSADPNSRPARDFFRPSSVSRPAGCSFLNQSTERPASKGADRPRRSVGSRPGHADHRRRAPRLPARCRRYLPS